MRPEAACGPVTQPFIALHLWQCNPHLPVHVTIDLSNRPPAGWEVQLHFNYCAWSMALDAQHSSGCYARCMRDNLVSLSSKSYIYVN
mmetsp:Transcript_33189/g.69506  ORF Transcript_33189/g.69506 Transcript_33189/m.69506 type:complete len:87 (-) Transcript_33189:873-1133(-)